MIKLTATALVHSVSLVLQVNSSFQKRELVLNDSWERDGEVHDNFVLIEFVGDKMPMLDTIAPGQRVTVEAFVNGREYQGRYFTTLRGLSVAPYQPQPQQAPQQQYPQQPAPAYQQPPYQQAQYPQAAPAYPAPAYPQQQPYQQAAQQPYQQAPQQAAPPQQAPQPQGYAAGGPTAANLPFPPKQ